MSRARAGKGTRLVTQNPWEVGGPIQPAQFGMILRDARLALGRSLQDAERQTRILARHLAALESGEFARLPPGIYARGFVYNYAGWLQLNPQEMVRLYNEARGEVEVYRPQPVARPVNTSGPFSPNFVVIIFVVGMLAVITAWGYTLLVQTPPKPVVETLSTPSTQGTPTTIARTVTAPVGGATGIAIGSANPPSAQGSSVASPSGTSAGKPSSVAAASVSPSAGASAAPGGTPTAMAGPFTFVITASKETYYDVTADGAATPTKAGILEAGQSIEITATKSVKVNAGTDGLTYTVNGQDRGRIPFGVNNTLPGAKPSG